jgi:hypothetical protein
VGSFFVSLKIDTIIRVARILMSVGKILESEVCGGSTRTLELRDNKKYSSRNVDYPGQ